MLFEFLSAQQARDNLDQHKLKPKQSSYLKRQALSRPLDKPEPTDAEYYQLVRDNYIDWDEKTKVDLQQFISEIEAQIKTRGLDLQGSVVRLSQSKGFEHSFAWYSIGDAYNLLQTRGNGDTLQSDLWNSKYNLLIRDIAKKNIQKALIVGLFNTWAYQHPQALNEMISVLGFKAVNVMLPDDLRQRQVTEFNDQRDYVQKVKIKKQHQMLVMPFHFYNSKSRFSPSYKATLASKTSTVIDCISKGGLVVIEDAQGVFQPLLQNNKLWFLSQDEIENPKFFPNRDDHFYYDSSPLRVLRETFCSYVVKPQNLSQSVVTFFDKHFKSVQLAPVDLVDIQQKFVELGVDEEGDDEFEPGARQPLLTGYSTIADSVPRSTNTQLSKRRAALVKK